MLSVFILKTVMLSVVALFIRWHQRNGTVRFKECKQLFEYQHLVIYSY